MKNTVRIAALVLAISATSATFADEQLDEVTAVFKGQYASFCDTLREDAIPVEPSSYAFSFNYSFEDSTDKPSKWTLYEFPCTQGAYNFGSVFYTRDEWGEIRAVQFAYPMVDITYEDPDDYESDVTDIKVIGYSALDLLFRTGFDPQALTISHDVAWRGLGDASEGGEWIFRDGGFMLTKYWYDPSYDGEINPATVYRVR